MFHITKENESCFTAPRSTEGRRRPWRVEPAAGRRARWAGACASFALCLWPLLAGAQQSVTAQQNALAVEAQPGFFAGAQLVTGFDSNVARQAEGGQVVPTQIDQAGILATFEHSYDRQHVSFSGNVERTVYREFALDDNTSQELHLGLQSDFPGKVTTDLKVSRYVLLANQADYFGVVRDILTENRLDGWMRFPLLAQWRGVLAAGAGRLRNSNPIDVPTNVDAVQLQAGVRYEIGKENYVNILGSSLQARYPDIDLLPASTLPALSPFHERGFDIETKWRFTGSSLVVGNVGHVSRRSEDAQVYWRNFSGPAYDLTYLWTPGSKFRFTFYALRATGEPSDNDYESAVTHTLRVTPAYQVTDRVRLDAQWSWSSVHYVALPAGVIPTPLLQNLGSGAFALERRNDILSSEGASAQWNPERWLQVRLSFVRQVRGSNIIVWQYADRLTELAVQARF
jgi:hypothetical protein